MAGVGYRRSCGTWTELMKDGKAKSRKRLTLMPTNAQVGEVLDSREAQGHYACEKRNSLGMFNGFRFNMKVRAEQSEDENLADPKFWYIPECQVWASNPRILPGYAINAQVAWHRPKNVGKGAQDGPRITGEVTFEIINPMSQSEFYGVKVHYDPFANNVRFARLSA